MKRIAIFGAKGYLGRQLTYYFSRKDDLCTGFDVPTCDVTNVGFWNAFDPKSYDAILFFAGLTGTERGFDEALKFTSVNEFGLLNLLTKLAPLGPSAPRIVFPSSRLIYKGRTKALKESDEKEVKTVYAVNKLACEGYLAAYSNRFGLPYNVIRICVPYGSILSAEYSYGTIGLFLKQLEEKGLITLFGGGVVRRTFTHVEDICRSVDVMVRGGINGVYNVGGTDLSLFECAQLLARKHHGAVQAVDWPSVAFAIESGSTVFDATKLNEDFGVSPTHNFLKDFELA